MAPDTTISPFSANRAFVAGLPVPFDAVHLNERSAEVRAATEGLTPCVVAHTRDGLEVVLAADDLRSTEANLAASPAAALTQQALAVGRTLARPLAAGDTVHASDLRARQWFAAGDTVRIVATGAGWRISGEGQALAAGLEGQMVRVRTESGRIVSGLAVAERLIEVPL